MLRAPTACLKMLVISSFVFLTAGSIAVPSAIAQKSSLESKEANSKSSVKNTAEKTNSKSTNLKATYESLLKPIDIFMAPPGSTKLLSLGELYKTIRIQGASIKVANEDLTGARQVQKTYKDRRFPTLSFKGAGSQDFIKNRFDSDLTDEKIDREGIVSSRKYKNSLGLSLDGKPLEGVKYSIFYPQYEYSNVIPDHTRTQPHRPHRGSITASLDIELLQNSVFWNQSPTERKQRLEFERARVSYKAEILKAIASGEKSFFDLIQKHLQLLVQQRAFALANALQTEVELKIAAGESSKLESMRSSLQSSQSEIEVVSSQIDFESALEEFIASLSMDRDEGKGIFPDPKSIDIDLEKIPYEKIYTLEQSKKNNIDIILARIALKNAEADLELARSSRLPSLALSTSYTNGAPSENYNGALSEPARPNDSIFTVGLVFTKVLYNDITDNDARKSIAAKQRAQFALEQAEQNIIKQHNALIKKLEIGSKRIRISKVNRELAELKLQSEYEKFKLGESSVRNVIDSQTEINSARITEIGARISMLQALGELRTLSGSFPQGVSLVDEAATK